MFRNYLKIALRNLVSNKWLSGLKVLSLGVGIAASLLLIVYINWQWSFDKFHSGGNNIVRINTINAAETSQYPFSAATTSGMAVWAKNSFPEVKKYVRMARWIANDVVLRKDNIVIRDENFLFVDSTFFDVFDFDFVEGDKATALNSPNTILLTASKAKAFFGNQSALGKTILFDGRQPFLITGVLKDVPVESHIQFSALCPMSSIKGFGMSMYQDNHFDMAAVFSYLELQSKTDVKDFTRKLNEKFSNDRSKPGKHKTVTLQKLHDIHLDNSVQYGLGESVNGKSIWALFGISILILLISWANQVNIFTAEIFGKSKPLNVSRILGAKKKDIWHQLVISASVSNILGVLTGLILTEVCLPVLSSMFNLPVKSLFAFHFAIHSPAFLMIVIIVLGIVFTSFFHTFLLSFTRVTAFLNRQEKTSNHRITLRKSLIVFQFSIIVALTTFGLLIYKQTVFMKEMPVEINLDNVQVLRSPLGFQSKSDKNEHFEYFYQEMKKLPEIVSVGFSGAIPGQNLSPFEKTVFDGKDFSTRIYRNYVAADLFDTYKFTFLSKSPGFISPTKDLQYAVINESAMRTFGYKNPLKILGKIVTEFDRKLEIIAVVKDHHQRSLHHPILPTLYDFTGKQKGGEDGFYSIRYHPNANLKMLHAKTATIFQKAFPFAAYDSFPIKDFYNNQYKWDGNFLQLIEFFIMLSVLIGIFGLIGISVIEIAKRTKEIAVRKILGASIPSIWLLISNYFSILILISFLVAIPIAWYFMNDWLQKYTYHTQISWWLFALAGIGTLLVTLLTVSVQAINAAIANPVKSLRTE